MSRGPRLRNWATRFGRGTRKPHRSTNGLCLTHRRLAVRPLEDRQMLSGTPLDVALISDSVAEAQQIQKAAAKDTIAIVYQAETMSTAGLVDLLASVSAAHGGAPIGHLGIVAHGGPGEIDLGSADHLSLATLPSKAAELQQLRSVFTTDARLDLWSCSVAAGPQGKAFVNALAADTGAAVFASDNPVGTVPGADFVWEYQTGYAVSSTALFSVQQLDAIRGLRLGDNAQLVSQSANPTNLAPGATFTKTWTMQNTGTTTWTPGDFGFTMNYLSGDAMGATPTTQYGKLSSSVAPGGTGVFTVNLTAPGTAGTYTGYWRMSNASYVRFGPTVTVQATVVAATTDGATLWSESANPTNLAPGATFTKTWTMQNTGTTTWTPGDFGFTMNYLSGDAMGATPTTQYGKLSSSVAPGGTGVFTVNLTAPGTAGTYTGYWRMSNASYVRFGPTVTVQATVAGTTATYNTPFLTDAELENYSSMTSEQIRAFLASYGSYFRQQITDVDGQVFDPPAVIAQAASQYQINPQVLLVTLQKESTGVTRTTRPSDTTMSLLMGAGSASTARAQLVEAARLLRAYQDELTSTGVTRSGWRVGVAKTTVDGVSVTPTTKAIAGQFTYTPYAGTQWGGNDPQWGGVYLFYHYWNEFDFGTLGGDTSTTATGFFYPTGRSDPYAANMPGFLAGGPGMPPYQTGVYHLGQDMEANVGDPVYAISDGEIVYVSAPTGGWGDDNYGLIVKHKLSDGTEFLALYGHVRPSLESLKYASSGIVSTPVPVSAGEVFATIGPGVVNGEQVWEPHLHFGVHPDATIPIPSPYGRMPLSNWQATNGFVDPVDWIKTHTPYTSDATPVLSVSTTSLTLPATTQGTAGGATSFTVSGSGLGSGDTVNVWAPTGCEISLDGSSFYTTFLLYPNASGILSSTTVYARIRADATANVSGNLTLTDALHSSVNKSIIVSGTVNPVPPGDPDDQVSEAHSVSIGSTVTGYDISPDTDVDMFAFAVSAGQRVGFDIDRPSGSLDSYIRLFNSAGTELAHDDDGDNGPAPGESSSVESYLEYTFANGGTYYLGVSGYGNHAYNATTGEGDTSGSTGAYSLTLMNIQQTPTDDAYEDNDTSAIVDGRPEGAMYSPNLGLLTSQQVISNLVMADSADWYKFQMGGAGTATNFVRIDFTHSQGDLDIEVYQSDGTTLVGFSNGVSNREEVSLNGQSAGIYYVKVYGYQGVSNPNYTLTINPATSLAPPTNVAASDGAYTDRVRVTWTASPNATGYEVWRNTSNNSGTATKITASDLVGLSYDDTTATAGTNYWYWVKGKNGAEASVFSAGDSGYRATVTGPANDNFADRKAGAGLWSEVTTNVGATKEPGEPNHAGNIGGTSIWWTWEVPFNGTVLIDTIGSNFDTLLAVYSGSSVSSLTTVKSDDNSGGSGTSKVTFHATAGTTLQIAVDGYGGASGNIAIRADVLLDPFIVSLTPDSDPVTQPSNVTLTAAAVSDEPHGRTVAKVEFYHGGVLLATDNDGGDGWSWTGSTAGWPLGENTVSARAQDNAGTWGALFNTTLTVQGVNQPPTIASLSDSPDPVTQGSSLTLTANSVTDSDGMVAKVEFYRDTNGNGSIDAGTDTLLGTDTSSSGGWTYTVSTSGFPLGSNTYMARAQDDSVLWSNTASTTGTISVAPSAPEITLVGKGVAIWDGDTTPTSADGTDFGWVHETLAGLTQTFTVRNNGTADLTLQSLSVPEGFTIVEGLSPTLGPGQSDTFTVRLDTDTRGIKAGNITFTTNDPDENPFTFAITGTVGPLAAPFDLTATVTSPTSVLLAWQNPNSAADRFTIDSKTEAYGAPWTTPINLTGGATTWQATGLTPYVAYHFRLIGYSTTGNPGTDEIKVMLDNAGNLYTLGKDGRLNLNGNLVRAGGRDFFITPEGNLYWLGTNGVFEQTPDQTNWQQLDDNATSFQVVGGKAYSVGTDKWLSVNGRPVWQNTEDYYIIPDGTIYWHGTSGRLQRRPNGASVWTDLDFDAIRYELDSNWACYSIGVDNWLNKNGHPVWQNTADYHLLHHANPALNDTLFWLGTSGRLQRRPDGESWIDLDWDAIGYSIDSAGVAYSYGQDQWLNVDGHEVWQNTAAYSIQADRSIYWLGTNGRFQRRPYGGSWIDLDWDATEVAIRDYWVAYSLGEDRWVNYEGTPTWDNVDDMFIDVDGSLILARPTEDVRLTDSYFETLG